MANKLPLVLNTDGSIERLQTGDTLTGWEPSQSGNSGKFLKTDGSTPSWGDGAQAITTATDYYVSTSGSDTTGDGSSGSPWASIDKAMTELDKWVILADVTIHIAKGSYPTTSQLTIAHTNGSKIKLDGAYETDTLTLSSSSGSAGAWSLVFTTSNTGYYTVGDLVHLHEATGGTNPQRVLGDLKVMAISAGISITVESPCSESTMASGTVSAEVSIPQVRWNRLVAFNTLPNTVKGIQTHYNCTSMWTYLWNMRPLIGSRMDVLHCIWYNSNTSRYGIVRIDLPAKLAFNYVGSRNLTYGLWARCSVLDFFWSGCTDCTIGLWAHSGGVVLWNDIHCQSCGTGLAAEYMSLIERGGGWIEFVGCTTDTSPARGTQGNYYSYMSQKMQLIIKAGEIIATHEDHQEVADKYPGCECVLWNKTLPPQMPGAPPLRDPRTEAERLLSYRDRRRIAYPSIQDQLDMMYHDKIDGTDTWVQAIESVKQRFPRPGGETL